MSQHLTPQNIELYFKRALEPSALLEADAHLSSCPGCRDILREKEGINASVKSLHAEFRVLDDAETEHPDYAQLTAYADNQLDEIDREIVDAHLSFCSECAHVLEDLRGFEENLAPSPARETRATETPGILSRFSAFWSSLTDRSSFQLLGATAALLLLVGISAAVWLNLKGGAEPVQTAGKTPTPEAARTVPPPDAPKAEPSPENRSVPGSQTLAQANQSSDDRTPVRTTSAPPGDSPRVVSFRDGERVVTVDGSGQVKGLEDLSAEDRQLVARALTNGRVETAPALATLVGSAGVLRGGTGAGVSFPILYPVGTVVLNERPTLRWGALEGASSYVVSVYDRNFTKVAESAPQSITQWTAPVTLERGRVYSWTVTAVKNGEEVISPAAPAPEAKFMILDQGKAAELARAKQSHAGSHLVMGTLYARAGLLEEAESEFQAFLRDNPKSALARKLLGSVRKLRGSN